MALTDQQLYPGNAVHYCRTLSSGNCSCTKNQVLPRILLRSDARSNNSSSRSRANPFSGSIPFLVNFGLAAAVFRPFLLGAAEKHHINKVLTVCWRCFNSTTASCVLTAQHEHVQCCRSLFWCGMSSIKLEWPFGLALRVLCCLGLVGEEPGAHLISSCSELHGLF